MHRGKTVFNKGVRAVLLAAGVISTALGILGIFLPLLPTTPFLLLAVACFARSSDRLHSSLINHPRYGKFIRDYFEGAGIPRRAKIVALILLWSSVTVSSLWVGLPAVRLLLFTVAAGVTFYLVRLPAADAGNPRREE